MHCRLLIPDLFPPDALFTEALSQQRFPWLETLVARGRRSESPWPGLEQWLLQAFSVARQEDWPSAPFALLGEGRAPGDGFWTHADPVHLRAERDRLLLADASLLAITAEESGALVDSLAAHFGDALRLEAVRPGAWYARIEKPPAGSSLPISEAGGALPAESASIGWHALMNEVQMLLHEHPVNLAREGRGAPAINGVWLWGGGRLAEATPPGFRAVLSSQALAAGLASAAGVRHGKLPDDVERWLEATDPDGVHLLVIDDLSAAARARDREGWIAALRGLEQRVIAPLASALKRGRLGMLTLHLAGGGRLLSTETIRGDLRHFWRRPRPLARHAAAN